jgi:heterotetrameric sarcosine oxidase gamma subunit
MNPSHDVHQRPSALRQAGIHERTFDAAGLHMGEIENPVLVRLRSLEILENSRLAAFGLPGQVGQVGQADGKNLAALCLAPGEWLLVDRASAASNRPSDLVARLQRELASDLTAVFDQSDGLAGLRVSGPAAPWLLGKLSCLDFARGTAAGPHCARTRMGDAMVSIHHHALPAAAWVFDLYVDRSVAQGLWALLTASAPHAAEMHENFGVFA